MSLRKALIVLLVVCFGGRSECQEAGNVDEFLRSLTRFVKSSYEEISGVHKAIFENFAELQERMTSLEANMKLCGGGSTFTFTNISTDYTTEDDPCEFPFHNVNGIGCIYLVANHYDWSTSREKCRGLGSDLFVAQDPEHFARLSSYIKERTFEDFWLGATSRRWLNDRPVASEEWGKHQPNKTFHSCAGSGDYAQYQVWDWECTWKGHALCQKILV